MAYDNTNSGMLSRNKRKEKENHPDYQGQCNINGVDMWISAWLKTGKPGSKLEGQKYFSLAFKPKNPAPVEEPPPEQPPASAPAPQDDELPPF